MTMDGMGYDLAINMHLQEVPMSSNRGKEEFQKTRRLRIPLKKNTKMPHGTNSIFAYMC